MRLIKRRDNHSFRAAFYLRLSRDDGEGESASIANQRRMLEYYAREHGFPVCGEYIDDGFSGTDFNRPAFRRLIADIERGLIDLVLVKDLSRLGREYLVCGQYLELFFPEHNVRCIAVGDNYDSADESGGAGLLAPFLNVVNESYARDASRKIRGALKIKRADGKYIGNFAPYGYVKDPADKNRLLPDEKSAAVVRKIFAWAAAGSRPSQIAAWLNARGEPTPLAYRQTGRGRGADEQPAERRWTASSVNKLLGNIAYLGHTAQGKTVKLSFKSKKTLRLAPEEWVVVENTHAPLVEADLFDLAQRLKASRACPRAGGFANIFSGLAFCADCGRAMSSSGTRKKGSPAALVCGRYKQQGATACTNHAIDYNALYRLVREALCSRSAPGAQPEEGLERLRLFAEIERIEVGQGRYAGKIKSQRVTVYWREPRETQVIDYQG